MVEEVRSAKPQKAQLWNKQGCGNGRVHAYTNKSGPCGHARHAFRMITATKKSNSCDGCSTTFRIGMWCSRHGPSGPDVHRHHSRLLRSDIRHNLTTETWSLTRAHQNTSQSITLLGLFSRTLPESPTPSKQVRIDTIDPSFEDRITNPYTVLVSMVTSFVSLHDPDWRLEHLTRPCLS